MSNHPLLQLSFLLTLYPSLHPEDEAPLGKLFAQGSYTDIGEQLEMLRDFVMWLFVPHLVVLPLSASPHLLSFLICALSPSSLGAFVHNFLPLLSLSQLFCLLL